MPKENHLSYKPTPDALDKISQIRNKVIELDDLFDDLTKLSDTEELNPATGRARALAKTHLEEARMWAVVAVVRQWNNGPAEEQGTVSGSDQAASEQKAAA